MSEVLHFMSESPMLTFLLALVACWTIVGAAQAFASIFRRRGP